MDGMGSRRQRRYRRDDGQNASHPFGDATQVLKYLARYTHRVAISNSRLLAYRAGQVTFRYKDYAQQGEQRTMTLSASEFIRRFLLHVLPPGFMRIRHYGYLANRHRRQKLELCRKLLGSPAAPHPPDAEPDDQPCEPARETAATIPCPVCQTGRLQIIEMLDRFPRPAGWRSVTRWPPSDLPLEDSS